MPDRRQAWPPASLHLRSRLLDKLDSLYALMFVGAKHRVDLINEARRDIADINNIIDELEIQKEKEYRVLNEAGKKGSWPHWVVNGLKAAPALLQEIEAQLKRIETAPDMILARVQEEAYKKCLSLVSRLQEWIREKKTLHDSA